MANTNLDRANTNSAASLSRSLSVFARASSIALGLLLTAPGCAGEGGAELDEIEAIVLECPTGIFPWIPQTAYKPNDLVTFEGEVFSARPPGHVAQVDWLPPIVPALWQPVECSNGNPAPEPPDQEEPAPPQNGFPALLDVRFFQLDLAAVGAPGNSGAIFQVVNAVAQNSVVDLDNFAANARVTFENDAQGRQVEVRRNGAFESRQTFAAGIQEAVATVGGKKRLQLVRNHNTGAFEGIIIAPSFDANAPISAFVVPVGGGRVRHLVIEDIANNQRNDYRGEAVVDAASLRPLEFVFFQQFQGGLVAQPESKAMVERFGGFAGIVRGF